METSVNYPGYKAKASPPARGGLRAAVRKILRFIKVEVFYNWLLYPYGCWRHRALLKEAHRSQSHTYTCFYRSPSQLEAFTGPVIQHVLGDRGANAKLRILVFACSSGAEAYTLAAALMKAHPRLEFHIEASDLHEEMVAKATAGVYSKDEVMHSEYISDEFIADVFERSGDSFVVRPNIRSRVTFSQANLLDPGLAKRFGSADVVFAQNVLFHLDPASASAAFESVSSLLKSPAALFIEGADLDLKVSLSRQHGLVPLAFKHREIYEQSRVHISLAWWNYYYGAEPYSWWRRDRVRRYSSIFLK